MKTEVKQINFTIGVNLIGEPLIHSIFVEVPVNKNRK